MNVIPLQGNLTLPIIGLGILLFIVVVSQSVEIVPAHKKRVLTVFGEYRKVLEPGVNFVVPFVSQTHSFDILSQELDIPQQTVIARDGVPVTADVEAFVMVMDAEKVFLRDGDYKQSASDLAQATLREVLGDVEFGDVQFDDMDPDEREALIKETRIPIENEYEEREGININKIVHGTNDASDIDWTIPQEINDLVYEEIAKIDVGLKQRMEITNSINCRIQEKLNTMTDGQGVEVVAEVANLNLDPDAQSEMDQHRASSPGDDHRSTE